MTNKLFNAKPGKQISIFLENRPGTLAEVINTLRKHGVNMLALSLSEGIDVGYVRIIVDKHNEAVEVLKQAKHIISVTDVVLLTVANKPGGLASAIDVWAKAGINVEYAYSADDADAEQSLIVAHVNKPKKAVEVLRSFL
ncbi:MAG: ACT domain-containing protein [Kiritimatiellae bacterium]|nr:ACT domain-containing protein [Kiritimatiellia bacterium]